MWCTVEWQTTLNHGKIKGNPWNPRRKMSFCIAWLNLDSDENQKHAAFSDAFSLSIWTQKHAIPCNYMCQLLASSECTEKMLAVCSRSLFIPTQITNHLFSASFFFPDTCHYFSKVSCFLPINSYLKYVFL